MFDGKYDANRESRRKELFYSFEVLSEKNRLIGHIGDLTFNGLKVISKNPIELNTDQQLKIKLPKRIGDRSEISFEAECVWCQKVDDMFHIGFKAEHKDRENINTIKIIIELLALPDVLIL